MAQPPAGAPSTSSETTYRRGSTFESLKYPDYRNMWMGQVGASASMWMEQIARPFLILALTDSALMLGLLTATRMVPQLLVGMWAGVLADRVDKKKLLIVTQAATFATHLVTALLILSGLIEPWMVFVTTFASGSAMAFNQPVKQALIARIVPDHMVPNAIALNSTAVNFMRIGGASIAGLLLVFLDFGELYLIQAVIYMLVIYWTLKINVKPDEVKKNRGSMLSELVEGLQVARTDPVIKYILLITMVVFIWGVPYQSVFIPLLAERELGIGSSGGAGLIALAGLGAIIGSLTIATIGSTMRRRGLVMIGLLCAMSLALVVLSRADTLVVAVPALLVAGAMQTSFMSVNHAYVLGIAPREMHGRIMSLFSLDRGLVPLGAAIGGVLAEVLGPQNGLLVMAAVCLGSTLLIAFFVPQIRRIT